MWPFWLIIAGLCFVIEIYTVGFFIFLFGIGALIALLVSLFTSNLVIQIVTFIVSSSLLVLFFKPFMNRFLKTDKSVPTNVFRLLDKEGVVVTDIDSINSTGQVKVKGELWSAMSDNDIAKGERVKVVAINGVKVKVEKIDKLNN